MQDEGLRGAGRNRLQAGQQVLQRLLGDQRTLDELILADECSPERALIAKETLEDLMAGLKTVPPRAAQAVILHRFEQLSYEEIAARMGVSVKAVEMNVRRTMERVMVLMEARR